MTFTPGSPLDDDEDIRGGATDEQINQAYKEAKINEQKDPRTDEKFLEERAKKKEKIKGFDSSESMLDEEFEAQKELQEDDPSAEQQFTEANRGFDILYEVGKTADKYLGTKGALGELFDFIKGKSEGRDVQFPVQLLLKEQKDLPKDPTKALIPPVSQTNVITRFFGEDISPNAIEFLKGLIMMDDKKKKRKRLTPSQIRELLGKGKSGQQTLFSQLAESMITPEEAVKQDTEEENNFNQKQYDIAKQFVFEDKPEQPFKVSKQDVRKLKQQARRPLKLIDVKRVQAKLNDPNITDEVVLNYFQDAKRSELGYGGTAGTIDFLNDMMDGPPGSLKKGFTSVDEFLANSSTAFGSFNDILEDMSFRLETPITKEKLQNLLDGTETYTFQTARMRKKGEPPIIINDAKSLTRAYFARLTALDDIGVFEKGHINAVDQIVERYLNEGIENTASFKDNTAPEISRSIYKLVGGEDNFNALFDEVRDYRVQGITDKDLKFAQVYAGNRTRKADQDLDRIVNSIFGVEPDLESSLLSYVYPEKSLNNLVASDMKVTFAKIFTKEFDELIQNVIDLGGKPENLGVNTLQSFRNQALKTAFESMPPDLSKDMGNMLAEYLRLNKIDVVDDKGDPRF